MKPNLNENNGANIDILKFRIENEIAQKDKVIRKLENDITEVEDIAQILESKVRWLDNCSKQLRQKREMAEIKCFKEILNLHMQILEITQSYKK